MNIINKNRPLAFNIICAVLLTAVSFAVYYKTLEGGFVYDDHGQIVKNQWIRDFRYLPRIFTADTFGFLEQGYRTNTYRPMVITAYLAEYAVFGLDPWGWHLLNVIFHSLNAIMVFLVISFLLKDRGGSGVEIGSPVFNLPPLIGAAVFAVHPVNAEPVAWLGCVPELLYTFLCLASFYMYIKSCEESPALSTGMRVLSVLFFFLAAFFKETAAALPVFILIYDIIKRKDEGLTTVSKIKRYIPYVLAGVAYLVMRYYAMGGGFAPGVKLHGYLTRFQFFLNLFPLFARYAGALIFPLNEYPIQPLDPVYSISETRAFLSVLLALSVALAIAISMKKLQPLYSLALAFIIVPLLPGLYSYNMSITPFSDRYLYFPTIGLALAVALICREVFVYSLLKKRTILLWGVLSVFFIAAIPYSTAARERSLFWKDDMALWSASAKGSPDNYIAVYSIGDVYLKKGLTDESIQKLGTALKINKEKAHVDANILLLTHKSLAEAYSKKGMEDELVREYGEILRMKPDDVFVNYNLAVIYQARGLLNDAIELYKTALFSARKPLQKRDILNNLGICYGALGRWDDAVSSYGQALESAPGDPAIQNNMKAALGMAGK